jgi:LPS O-antigen subunit length determinant protein (WzzB/FepE family)
MWRSKKFIIIAVLIVLVVGVTLGSVAIAQADDEDTSTTQTANVSSFLEKVAEIYQTNTGVAIDPAELQQAMTEATQTLRDEALDNYLQKLVGEEKITQEQADDFKAWLDAKPSLPIDEFKEWWNAKPDMSGLFNWNCENSLGTFGKVHRVMNKLENGFGMKGYRWCVPDNTTE